MEGFVKPAVMLKGKDLWVGFKQNVNRQKESAALDLFSLCAWSHDCQYLFKKSSFYTTYMYFSDVGTVSLSLRDWFEPAWCVRHRKCRISLSFNRAQLLIQNYNTKLYWDHGYLLECDRERVWMDLVAIIDWAPPLLSNVPQGVWENNHGSEEGISVFCPFVLLVLQ